MKKLDKQRMMYARTEWLRRALSLKTPERWISIEEIYGGYLDDVLETRRHGGLVDRPNRETYRKWLGHNSDFVEIKTVVFEGHTKRMYRMKKEQPEKSCLSLLGQKAAKLGRYLFNGKCNPVKIQAK